MTTISVDPQAANIIEQVEKNGFFVLPNFLDRQVVLETRAELAAMLDEDLALMEARKVAPAQDVPAKYHSWMDQYQHCIDWASTHSPGLANLIEHIITHPSILQFTDRVLGQHYRMRDDLVRRLTGVNDHVGDFFIPHAWHRDSPGEFTFGIFFDDVTEPYSGATIAIKGTHPQPYDPLWDMLMDEKSYLSRELWEAGNPARFGPELTRYAVLNKVLRQQLRGRVQEISGRPGDLFFFLNDVWHGRSANVHGTKNIIVRFGGFPTDFPFKDDMPLPAGIAQLPPALRARYEREQPVNTDPTTYVRRLNDRRRQHFDLFRAANLEKRLLAKAALTVFRPRLSARPVGSSVEVQFSSISSPTGGDWIVVYAAGEPNERYLGYRYTNDTASAGDKGVSRGAVTITLPAGLGPGDYEVRLFSNNSFALLATTSFNVPAPTLSASPSVGPDGPSVTVHWSGIFSPSGGDWLVLYRAGAPDDTYVTYRYTNGTSAAGESGPAAGQTEIPLPADLPAGPYEVRLFTNNSFTRLASAGVTLEATAQPHSVSA